MTKLQKICKEFSEMGFIVERTNPEQPDDKSQTYKLYLPRTNMDYYGPDGKPMTLQYLEKLLKSTEEAR